MPRNKVHTKRWVLIHEGEFELLAVRSGVELLKHLESNDPTTVGRVTLEEKDAQEVALVMKSQGCHFVSIPWAKYADQLGLRVPGETSKVQEITTQPGA